jgi:hypothetical protein
VNRSEYARRSRSGSGAVQRRQHGFNLTVVRILRAAFSASSALDEADTQIPLELSHPFAELRLGLAGRARRGGEAAVAHHLREIMQIVQILQMTPHAQLIVSREETVCRSHAVYS